MSFPLDLTLYMIRDAILHPLIIPKPFTYIFKIAE